MKLKSFSNKIFKTTLLSILLTSNCSKTIARDDSPFAVKKVTADNPFNAPHIYAKPYANCRANYMEPPYNLSYVEWNADIGKRCLIPLTTCALNGPMKEVDCKDTVPFWQKPIELVPNRPYYAGYRVLPTYIPPAYMKEDKTRRKSFVQNVPGFIGNGVADTATAGMNAVRGTGNFIMVIPKKVLELPVRVIGGKK